LETDNKGDTWQNDLYERSHAIHLTLLLCLPSVPIDPDRAGHVEARAVGGGVQMREMNHEKTTSWTNEHFESMVVFLSSAIRSIAVSLP